MGTVAEEWSLLPFDKMPRATLPILTERARRRATVMKSDVGDCKQQWVSEQAQRLLQNWRKQQSPFGIGPEFIRQLERDLAQFYDQPLIRNFIENSD